jgi:hypothetical protein
MGMVIRMAIGALTTDMAVTIRMAIGALTTDMAVTIRIAALTLIIVPIIDMRRIADIGSSSKFFKETATGGLLANCQFGFYCPKLRACSPATI